MNNDKDKVQGGEEIVEELKDFIGVIDVGGAVPISVVEGMLKGKVVVDRVWLEGEFVKVSFYAFTHCLDYPDASASPLWERNYGKILVLRELLGKGTKDSEKPVLHLQKLPNEITSKLDKGLTICLSCGYSGNNIQGDCPDLWEGYGCPKCHSPLVVKQEKVKSE